jgi:hypothetical protein
LQVFFCAFLIVINQRVPITTNKSQGNRELVMPAVDQFRESLVGAPESALSEIHHSKISLNRAKAHYDYPTIRLQHSFSKLAGLQTRIYQTVHDGGLAFLVVVSQLVMPQKKVQLCQKVLRKTLNPPSSHVD